MKHIKSIAVALCRTVATVAVISLVSGGVAQAASIALNFTTNRDVFAAGPNPLGASDLAGLVAQTNWNNTSGTSGSFGNSGSTANITGGGVLRDDTGASTSTTVTWNAGSGGQGLTISGAPNNADAKIYKDYLEGSSGTTSPINVSMGNIAYSIYDVIVYVGDFADNPTFISKTVLNGTSSVFYVNGKDIPTFGGYVKATGTNNATANLANYVRFNDVVGASFSLNIFKVTGNRAAIAGLQIVQQSPIPEPGTLAILGLGLAGLGLMRRRKRRAA